MEMDKLTSCRSNPYASPQLDPEPDPGPDPDPDPDLNPDPDLCSHRFRRGFEIDMEVGEPTCTAGYVSPEQLVLHKSGTPADMWSLGATLAEVGLILSIFKPCREMAGGA